MPKTFNIVMVTPPDTSPGQVVTMQGTAAAATSADVGTFDITLFLFRLGSPNVTLSAQRIVNQNITTTPQTFTRTFTLASNEPLGAHAVRIGLEDASGFQTTNSTGGNFNVVSGSVASLVKVSGDNLGGTVGAAQVAPMVVRALDASGNAFPNAVVSWITSAGTLSSATSTTDAGGNASVTLTYPSSPQPVTVTASVGSLSVAFTNTCRIPLYGTFSPFPKLLHPAGSGDPLAGAGFLPNDGLIYNLVAGASDEFDGTSLDASKWWKRYKDNSGTLDHYNNELQRYGDGHTVSNGSLKLTAAPRSPAQYITMNGQQFPLFDSQMIRSRTLVKYGYAEIRAKQPAGVGMWPAFWILPQVGAYPEIDNMDDAKNGVTELWNMSHSNVSNVPSWNGLKLWSEKNKNASYNFWKAPAPLSTTYFSDDFHVWSCLWEPDTVTTYIDGFPVSQWALKWVDGNNVDPGGASVIANLAVGDGWATNNWTVQPDISAPHVFEIDYIRVFQRPDIAFTAVSSV